MKKRQNAILTSGVFGIVAKKKGFNFLNNIFLVSRTDSSSNPNPVRHNFKRCKKDIRPNNYHINLCKVDKASVISEYLEHLAFTF
jgi:hypothetical protein